MTTVPVTPGAGGAGNGEGGDAATFLPRQYLRAALLVLLAEAPEHGYRLPEHLADLGIGNVDRAHLYRTLRALEAEGLVASCWERSSAGPARRTYELTESGVALLSSIGAAIRATHGCLGRFLSRFDKLA